MEFARILRPKDRYKLEVLKRKLRRQEAIQRAAREVSARIRKEREEAETSS